MKQSTHAHCKRSVGRACWSSLLQGAGSGFLVVDVLLCVIFYLVSYSFPIMSDYTFEVLRQQAESLELTGVDAARYIQEQQIAYRDERAKERELEKIRIEAERKKVKLAHDLEMAKTNSSPCI